MTEAPAPPAPEPINLKDPVVAGLLAWLLPGLGHWYQGRRAKAVLYFVAIMGLFVFGVILGGGSYTDDSHVKHELSYGRAVYFSWHAGDRRWQYLCQVGVGLPALPALVQAARMNHHQQVWFEGFMAPPWLSEPARDAAGKKDPNADQPARQELDRWIPRRFEVAGVFGMIAGLLNVLAIYDACAGPVIIPPAKQDEEEDEGEEEQSGS